MTLEVDNSKLPSYDQPPITEVACSVLFSSITGLLSPHIGLLWQKFQPQYPFCDDLPLIVPRIEIFGNQLIDQKIEITQAPQLPRVWFINQDGTRIIQIQRDRFIHNWRKVRAEDEYPRYGALIETFQRYLNDFDLFLQEADLGRIQPIQYELTYVNQIPRDLGWRNLGEIGRIFPDISWRRNSQRFLPYPQNIAWNTVFDLPEEFGRLHVTVNSVVLNEHETILFELTVRGIGSFRSLDEVKRWFDSAHDWIVRAFADLTHEKTQTQRWKRKE